VNKILKAANRGTSTRTAAVIISVSYLVSRLLGLLRDRLLAAHFGISPLTDAYTAAFRLPELLFTLLVSGAFAVAFIPVLSQKLEHHSSLGCGFRAGRSSDNIGSAGVRLLSS
jgi:peptidoglycan biosynthesis protein MviN/MurJ (putative lipid II flippase)